MLETSRAASQGSAATPVADSPQAPGNDHFARFYLDDATLIESVAQHVMSGLRDGAAAVVIATEPHLTALDRFWASIGFDAVAYRDRGQLLSLDAAQTLAGLMVDGTPDRERFRATVGAVIARLSRQYGRVAAFGEMVGLLWHAGNPAAAVDLESLWNELREDYRFSLLCGYALRDCTADTADQAFEAACDAHAHVIPAETYPASSTADQSKIIVQLQRKALALESRLERDRETQRSLAHFAAIVECSDDAIISKTLDSVIRSWNPGAQRLFGYTAEEAVGKPITIIIPRDRLDEETRIIETLKRGERVDHYETTRLTKDGREVEVSLTVSPVWDAAGTVIGASKIARDITARKRSEALLRDREQRLTHEAKALTKLNELSSRLWGCQDLHQGVDAMLEAAIELVGADKGNVQLVGADGVLRIEAQRGFGREFLEYFKEVATDDESACGRALRFGEQVIIEDIELDEAYAALRPMARSAGYRAVVSTPLISADGVAQGMLSMHFSGVHRPTELELNRLALYVRHASDFIHRCKIEQMLRQADQRKDEFLALLAHELRNPLAPIRYALTANRKADRTPEQRRWADDIIERQVTHMSRLLEDLLDVSRITRGKLQLKKEPAELTSVLAAAIETARPLLDSKQHRLSLDFPKEAVRFQADPVRLAQVFSNLLINAAKYTDPHGHIQLSVACDSREVVVRVRDTGIGISREMMPRLFEMFSQAETALARSQGGLGVGLALVRGLVALHEGTVQVQSEGAGRGCEFTVRLPLKDPISQIPRCDRIDDATSGAGLRILIVDDNRDAADTCAAVLELSGHHVQTAYTPHQALELAEVFRPHAILLDIGLPEVNGYSLATKIRQTTWGRGVVLVAVTGWGQSEDRRRAFEAGFDHHLTKPVTPEAIESVLQVVSSASSRLSQVHC
jgi:PAS domain S-box-containing protein